MFVPNRGEVVLSTAGSSEWENIFHVLMSVKVDFFSINYYAFIQTQNIFCVY